MFPSTTQHSMANGNVTNCVPFCQSVKIKLTRHFQEPTPDLEKLPGLHHLPRFQFSEWMLFATQNWLTAFRDTVLSVLFWGSEKQVIRIATGWIIALVAHEQTGRNWSIMKFPRKARRYNRFRANLENPVSTRGSRPNPQPTPTFIFSNQSPKPSLNSLRVCRLLNVGITRMSCALTLLLVLGKIFHSFSLPRLGYWPYGAFSLYQPV